MNYKDLSRPLSISDVDFRIQSINNGGYATILAYKDARVDMIRLDEVLTPFGWQRDYKLIDGKLFCGVGIWHEETERWVWKWDVGTESNTEKEKGQASDSFKRACFNLGIGRELYSYPFISVKLNADEWEKKKDYNGKERATATFNLKLKDWRWYSEFTDDQLTFLAAKDQNGVVRFKYGTMKPKDADVEPIYKPASGADIKDEEVLDVNVNISAVASKTIESEDALEKEVREKAAQLYFEVFGKKPHGKMSAERIEQEVESHRAKANAENVVEIDTHEEEALLIEDKDDAEVVAEVEEEIEELEVEDVDQDTILSLIDSIETHTDPKEFVAWAKSCVEMYKEIDTQDVIDGFKELCNSHYSKLMK